ncbi:MAG: hypothetical protein JXA28_04865 [Bacteroidetes bacterium]|nr:hypothetical protein [Bacteroidota bacterium]
MTFDEAMKKGYLNIDENEAEKLIGELFDNDDPGARMDAGIALLGTFIPQEKLVQVLDLASVILDAHEELEMYGEDGEDVEGEEED